MRLKTNRRERQPNFRQQTLHIHPTSWRNLLWRWRRRFGDQRSSRWNSQLASSMRRWLPWCLRKNRRSSSLGHNHDRLNRYRLFIWKLQLNVFESFFTFSQLKFLKNSTFLSFNDSLFCIISLNGISTLSRSFSLKDSKAFFPKAHLESERKAFLSGSSKDERLLWKVNLRGRVMCTKSFVSHNGLTSKRHKLKSMYVSACFVHCCAVVT